MSTKQLDLNISDVIDRYLTREALDRYYVELMSANQSVNLVSRETSREDFDRLCAESLLPLDVLPNQLTNYLDIGAGGGIPAIPLILSRRISGQSVLVERTIKKAAALERITSALSIPCEIVARTFEELTLRDRFDLITLRYVKLDRSLFRKILPLLSANGHFVYYSTADVVASELQSDTFEFLSPGQDIAKHFTVFRTK